MFNKSRGGPRTALGKKRSSQNARRHGLFANEFNLSTADQAEYKKLTSDLREALRPNNALLDVIFQDVMANAWKIKIGLRYEQQEFLKEFSIEKEESPEVPKGAGLSFPYGLKARKGERAIKLLEDLKATVKQEGTLSAELEKEVTQTCGPDLWKMLQEWAPDSVGMLISRIAMVAVEKSQLFGTELPNVNVSSEEEKKYGAAFALKHQAMLCKIIDIYMQLLIAELRRPEREGGMLPDERLSRLDLSMRYQTTARRDFYRSLREYWAAKDRG